MRSPQEGGARAMLVVYVLQVNDGTPDSDVPEAYYVEAAAMVAAQREAEKIGVPVPAPGSWQESDGGSHIASKSGDVVFTIWCCPVRES